jgi:phenylalanyl-tRNA synthetase beta chain
LDASGVTYRIDFEPQSLEAGAYTLRIGPQVLDALGIPEGDPRRELVTLANPISEEEPGLRTTLLPPLLATLKRNVGRGQRDVALYELGTVFSPAASANASAPQKGPPRLGVDHRPSDKQLAAVAAALPVQPWHVAAVLTGDSEPDGWWGPARPATWADARGRPRGASCGRCHGADGAQRAGAMAPGSMQSF